MEARIAAGDGVIVVCGNDRRRLLEAVRDATTPATRGVISFGLAGGLKSGLRPGACVIARGVLGLGEGFATDAAWTENILRTVPNPVHADLAGTDRPILLPSEKRALHARTGAVAVDMESQIAARVAHDRGLPFAAVRVVIDPVDRPVPRAALAGYRPDGTTDARAVLSALWRQPRELPGVIRLAYDAAVAARVLLRCRRQLGEAFALVNVSHHPLDMA
jgi:hopanoid-associated phosphorylase